MSELREYKGVKHKGLDYYLREILECTEKSWKHVCLTDAVHSEGYLYKDFAAAIEEFLESSKETH